MTMTVPHETEIFVRFCESDALGHVNNTSYFFYLEEARMRFFSEVYPERSSSFAFIVASICCTYKSEAFPKQTLKISTGVEKIGSRSFTLNQIIRNYEDNTIVAEGNTVIVSFDYPRKKSINIPENLHKNLEKHLIVGN